MSLRLAADIGGTRSRILVKDVQQREIWRQSYPSANYASLTQLLREVIAQTGPIDAACLAVAGPVNPTREGQQAQVTNLPWLLDSEQLKAELNIPWLLLINDFAAVGYGLDELAESDLLTLQPGKPQPNAPRALIGAGTGLGQALLLPQPQGYRVHATEGGHVDFAPNNALQQELLTTLNQRYPHVSVERVLSGPGLVAIFSFLADRAALPSDALEAILSQDDAAAHISHLANQQQHPLARQALDMFVQIYGAQAGNLALSVLPYGGLYIAGGIAAKILPRLQKGDFMAAFLHKGRMNKLLTQIPVNIVLNPDVGLLGALKLASSRQRP
ncbi:MAG: glucokinase [Gammaproteobacteria bacterium]|nr:glucokinase [Gammaproteobacteria bacterium]